MGGFGRVVGLVVLACGCGSHSSPPAAVVQSKPVMRAAAVGDVRAVRPPDTPIAEPPRVAAPPPIVVGAADRILLLGTLVTPDVVPDTVPDGAVLVERNLITCVGSRASCAAMAGASGATVIETGGIIGAGLIDTHNHILFDIFNDDDWLPARVYQDHDQWPNEPRYKAMLDVKQCLVNAPQGKPAWCAQSRYGTAAGNLRCEIDKWGELKALVAGTTSIVGLAGTTSDCVSSLARLIDSAHNGLGQDKLQTSALFPPSTPSTVCKNFASAKTTAFIVHAGEGTDAKALAEFNRLGTMTTPKKCLYASHTAITHGTAFTATEFAVMAAANMKLVWSPHSNVSLYGQTANIAAALDAGVKVSIAPDWSMGGSQNMLDEFRFADAWDNAHWNDRLSAKDIVMMGTLRGAQVVGLEGKLGTLEVGHLADIAVFGGDTAAPYEAILAARPRDVRLVMVNGVALYGDDALRAAGPARPGCEAIDICGARKFLCVATTATTNKFDQTYSQIHAAIDQALVDADALTPADGFNFAPVAPLVTCN